MPPAVANPPADRETEERPPAPLAATTAVMDWEGNALEPWAQSYADYLDAMPTREALRPYDTPACYWEVVYPGCALQPYPRMASFSSTAAGIWRAQNAVQEEAIREHIRISTHADPDRLKIDPAEIATLNGGPGDIRFCQDCTFVCSSFHAVALHERLCGHRTDSRPRKD